MTAKFSKKIYDTYPYLRTIKEMPESELLSFLLYLRADTLTKVNDVIGLDEDIWNEMLSRGMPGIESAAETLLNDAAKIISDHNYDGVSFRNLENVHRILQFCKGHEHIIIRRTEGEVSTVVEGEEHIDKIIEEIELLSIEEGGDDETLVGLAKMLITIAQANWWDEFIERNNPFGLPSRSCLEL